MHRRTASTITIAMLLTAVAGSAVIGEVEPRGPVMLVLE